ncbi:MAG: 1-(5-phosphoribosyl)-5-[(5-phosphoribosylamino)methylideneamino]imidazole-4-carboxamide isomerase [Deltaproteobacteria bacterium]|nr:1-(5-phosphoribosyl)-5-[(5-phosphoribosylamino)methylideneamino]imidazole-4-carboxamide isomerase [Deltaproteobacteria bacterium]
MLVIPAIDIKAGRCVRLKQGRMSEETVYSQAPEDMALKWYEKGAERLHVVDLDGAMEKRPVNAHLVKKIVLAVPIPVQLGGGIRSAETIAAYLDEGVQAVILGSAACSDPDLLYHACRRFPDRIILGIDARMGRVAVEGWTQETELSALEVATRFEENDIAAIIYTDIQRDGMSTGPNLTGTKDLANSVSVPVIASGGISGIKDVMEVCALSKYGVTGMITGRALYEGTLDLQEAIRVAREKA